MQAVVKIHEYLHDGIKILTEWRGKCDQAGSESQE